MKPKDVEKILAEYQNVHHARMLLDEESKKLKVDEDALLDKLTAGKVESGTYGAYRLTVNRKSVPRCTDWSNFYAYIRQNNSFDMLHKRLTESAVMARVEAGEYVPGLMFDDKYTYKVVS
jgi:hypothetical protein